MVFGIDKDIFSDRNTTSDPQGKENPVSSQLTLCFRPESVDSQGGCAGLLPFHYHPSLTSSQHHLLHHNHHCNHAHPLPYHWSDLLSTYYVPGMILT